MYDRIDLIVSTLFLVYGKVVQGDEGALTTEQKPSVDIQPSADIEQVYFISICNIESV